MFAHNMRAVCNILRKSMTLTKKQFIKNDPIHSWQGHGIYIYIYINESGGTP